GGEARCGLCSAGHRLDVVSGECVDERICGEGFCAVDEMPEHHGDGTCACVPRVCGEGEAKAPDGSCVTCPAALTCDGEGETGELAPSTTKSMACVCETKPGYFIPTGGDGQATPCDEDGDGWVRRSADSA